MKINKKDSKFNGMVNLVCGCILLVCGAIPPYDYFAINYLVGFLGLWCLVMGLIILKACKNNKKDGNNDSENN